MGKDKDKKKKENPSNGKVGPYSRNPRPVKEVVEVFGQVSGSSHKSISSFDRKRELTSRDEAALKKHPSGKKIDAENCSDDKKSKMLNSSATMRKMDRMAKRKSGMESRSVVKRAKSPPTGTVESPPKERLSKKVVTSQTVKLLDRFLKRVPSQCDVAANPYLEATLRVYHSLAHAEGVMHPITPNHKISGRYRAILVAPTERISDCVYITKHIQESKRRAAIQELIQLLTEFAVFTGVDVGEVAGGFDPIYTLQAALSESENPKLSKGSEFIKSVLPETRERENELLNRKRKTAPGKPQQIDYVDPFRELPKSHGHTPRDKRKDELLIEDGRSARIERRGRDTIQLPKGEKHDSFEDKKKIWREGEGGEKKKEGKKLWNGNRQLKKAAKSERSTDSLLESSKNDPELTVSGGWAESYKKTFTSDQDSEERMLMGRRGKKVLSTAPMSSNSSAWVVVTGPRDTPKSASSRRHDKGAKKESDDVDMDSSFPGKDSEDSAKRKAKRGKKRKKNDSEDASHEGKSITKSQEMHVVRDSPRKLKKKSSSPLSVSDRDKKKKKERRAVRKGSKIIKEEEERFSSPLSEGSPHVTRSRRMKLMIVQEKEESCLGDFGVVYATVPESEDIQNIANAYELYDPEGVVIASPKQKRTEKPTEEPTEGEDEDEDEDEEQDEEQDEEMHIIYVKAISPRRCKFRSPKGSDSTASGSSFDQPPQSEVASPPPKTSSSRTPTRTPTPTSTPTLTPTTTPTSTPTPTSVPTPTTLPTRISVPTPTPAPAQTSLIPSRTNQSKTPSPRSPTSPSRPSPSPSQSPPAQYNSPAHAPQNFRNVGTDPDSLEKVNVVKFQPIPAQILQDGLEAYGFVDYAAEDSDSSQPKPLEETPSEKIRNRANRAIAAETIQLPLCTPNDDFKKEGIQEEQEDDEEVDTNAVPEEYKDLQVQPLRRSDEPARNRDGIVYVKVHHGLVGEVMTAYNLMDFPRSDPQMTSVMTSSLETTVTSSSVGGISSSMDAIIQKNPTPMRKRAQQPQLVLEPEEDSVYRKDVKYAQVHSDEKMDKAAMQAYALLDDDADPQLTLSQSPERTISPPETTTSPPQVTTIIDRTGRKISISENQRRGLGLGPSTSMAHLTSAFSQANYSYSTNSLKSEIQAHIQPFKKKPTLSPNQNRQHSPHFHRPISATPSSSSPRNRCRIGASGSTRAESPAGVPSSLRRDLLADQKASPLCNSSTAAALSFSPPPFRPGGGPTSPPTSPSFNHGGLDIPSLPLPSRHHPSFLSSDEQEAPISPQESTSLTGSDPSNSVGSLEWNERFQVIQEQIQDNGGVMLLSESEQIYALAQDFIDTAKTYGQIIILERHSKNKTIVPCKLGGLAGGEKFIVNNILFKFATDTQGIYSGGDFAAGKVAAHDLKGLMAYLACGIPALKVPLMAIVDFLGFRVTAMSLLPISPSTLIYGTRDGGRTIHNSNPLFNETMQDAAKRMNLASHLCGTGFAKKILHSAADIEGHRGRDGRFYLIDFSRTFPPTDPNRSIPFSHLFQLFRPEFLATYKTPLCSDAFSGFVREDPLRKDYNEKIVDATQVLINVQIPQLVASLEMMLRDAEFLETVSISEQLHKAGVNVRFIGHAMRCTSERSCYILLLIESISRCLKNELHKRMRDFSAQLEAPITGPYKSLVTDYMNCVFGESQDSADFWETVVIPGIRKFFNVEVSEKENLRSILNKDVAPRQIPARYYLFLRLQSITCLKFNKSIFKKMESKKSFVKPFDILHLKKFGVQIKHTSIVTNAEANFLVTKAIESQRENDLEESQTQLQKAKSKYEETLASSPNDREALIQIARLSRRIMEVEGYLKEQVQLSESNSENFANIEELLARTRFSMLNSHVLLMETYFLRAVDCDPTDCRFRFLYACFLLQGGQLQRAHDMLLELTENIYPDHRAFPEIVFSLSLIIMTIMERPAELLCAKVKLILDLEDFLKKFSVT